MTPDQTTVKELNYLADLDLHRIRVAVLGHVPKLVLLDYPPPRRWERITAGHGEHICVKCGYPSFRANYSAAVTELIRKIKRLTESIKGPLGICLDWHYQLDGDCNVWGDTAWHKYQIFRKRPWRFSDLLFWRKTW